MPRFDNFYPFVSYVTGSGAEIVLSAPNGSHWWEIYGRNGFAAPKLKQTNQQYADGTTELLAVEIQPRTLVMQMAVSGQISADRDNCLRTIANKLIQIGAYRDWGHLHLRRPDGTYCDIDCAYISGMDAITQTLPRAQVFEIKFYSGNGYFYDPVETIYDFDIYRTEGLLHFGNDFHFTDETFFRSNGVAYERDIFMDGYRAYPTITITGPANNISLINQATGRTLSFDPSFFLISGDSVTIRTTPKDRGAVVTRADGTEKNGFKYLTPDSNLDWFLCYGMNALAYRNSNNNPTTLCRLAYKKMWLSA